MTFVHGANCGAAFVVRARGTGRAGAASSMAARIASWVSASI